MIQLENKAKDMVFDGAPRDKTSFDGSLEMG